MDGSILSVPLPLLRFGTSPTNLHKDDENSDFPVEKTVSTTDYFSGRYSANGFLKEGTDPCKVHSDISPESRLSDKSQKNNTRNISEYVIFGNSSETTENIPFRKISAPGN